MAHHPEHLAAAWKTAKVMRGHGILSEVAWELTASAVSMANAGLNPSEIDGALDLIRRISARGITIMIIEHVMKVVLSLSERILVLHHGELISEDMADEVVNDERVIEAYLGTKFAELVTVAIQHADVMRLGCPVDAHEPIPSFVHHHPLPCVRAAAMPADPCTGALRRRLPTGHPSRPLAGARVPPGLGAQGAIGCSRRAGPIQAT